MTMFPTMLIPQRRFSPAILDTTPMPIQAAAAATMREPSCPVAELSRYTTLMDLRSALRAMETQENVSVVLVLDERFCGPLTSLVARPADRPAMRLVLAVGSGRLPGLETIGDLAAGGAALGWNEIMLEHDAADAVRGTLATLRRDERLIVFAPSWHTTDALERELDRVA